MDEFLRVEGLTKRFGDRSVLDDVSFSVRRGEVLGLIGPNGAGKTTLFECLSGLMTTDRGAVSTQGKMLPATQRKASQFYLPDAIRPWAEQTVQKILRLFERLYARPRADVALLAEPLRLNEILAARIGSLSKGELKRTL